MPGGGVTIKGLSRGVKRVEADANAEMAKRLNKAGEYLRSQMVRNLRQGSTRRDGPSAPGEFPHADTGKLSQSVQVRRATPGNQSVSVGTTVDYGRFLEEGTGKMEARPWLVRTLENEWPVIERILQTGK